MRTLFVLMWLGVATLGADTDIRIFSTTKTNEQTAVTYTTDIFTRDGQTNLVRVTRIKSGVVQARSHKFYHHGLLICDYFAMGESSSGFSTEAGCPYSVTLDLGPSKEIRSVIFGTNGVTLDSFTCTNGVFSPVDGLLIKKANALTQDLKPLFSPAHITNAQPQKFGQEVEGFIRKHQNK